MANIQDLVGSLDEQNKDKQKQEDRQTSLDAVTQSGDKVAKAVDKNSQDTVAALGHVKGEVNVTNPDLAKSQDVGQAVEAINKLNLTAFMQNEGLPQLAKNLEDLSSKTKDYQDQMENQGLKKMSEQLSIVVKKLDEVAKKIGVAEITVDSKLQKTINSLSKSIDSIDFKPSVNVSAPETRVISTPVDYKPLLSGLDNIEKAIRESEKEETPVDFSEVTGAVNSVQKAITALRFPVPNYVLPFVDKVGKATQAKTFDGSVTVVNPDGTTISGGGGGGGGAVTIADGADVTLGAKADAKNTATDTTPITIMSVLKQISASAQAPPSQAVTNTGTFIVQATLAAETTKVIGTVNQGTSPWVTSNTTTSVVGNGAAATAQRVTLANDSTGIIATVGAVTAITNALPSGTNLLGKVGIDQTTPGTTNKVSIGTDGVVSTAFTDTAPGTQNITAVDAVTASSSNQNAQTFYTGTPTAGSAASFALSGQQSVRILVTGTWSATLQAEYSIDSGTTWHVLLMHQNSIYNLSTGITGNFTANAQTTGMTNIRIRCTAYTSGTAVVRVVESAGEAVISLNNAPPSGNFVSTNNSTTATLTSGSVFTGIGDDAREYSEIRITVFADQASATNGLSIQQSSDNTNWDVTDIYTVPITSAGNGKTFSVPRQARYFRVVYTNGGTNQGTFRLQTILNRIATTASSQRPSDAYSNENDFEQVWAVNSVWNGSTWDRMSGDTTGVNVKNIVGSIIPGTAATNLGKAEDAAHASGDTGVFALGVRNDGANTAFSGTNGDYTPLGTDAQGRLYVVQKAPTATLSNVSSSATTVTILAANDARMGATLFNDSTQICYVKFGTTASTTSYTVQLATLTYYEIPSGYTGRIDGIWVSANGTMRVTEMT